MAIGISVVLIALGAILTWGTRADVSGVPLSTVGVVLIVLGAVGIFAAVIHAPDPLARSRRERVQVDR
jgi:hypothetical protein